MTGGGMHVMSVQAKRVWFQQLTCIKDYFSDFAFFKLSITYEFTPRIIS